MKRRLNTLLLFVLIGFGASSCLSDMDIDEIVVEEAIDESKSDTDGTDGNSSGQNPPPKVG